MVRLGSEGYEMDEAVFSGLLTGYTIRGDTGLIPLPDMELRFMVRADDVDAFANFLNACLDKTKGYIPEKDKETKKEGEIES